jgi:Zn-dependent protease with chaperone function
MTSYRYPTEQIILAGTLLLVFGVIALTAPATLGGGALFVGIMVAVAYFMNSMRHSELMRKARRVTPQAMPQLAELVQGCAARLKPGRFVVFVAPANVLNAYTFGLEEPRTVVVYTGVLNVMDADEVRFIVGHELGHVALGHTWLNSLVGGMAGIPSPYLTSALLYFVFRWWNRACEYSADRAGLLACGRPDKAISALVKLTGQTTRSPLALQQAIARIEAHDDALASVVGEAVSTHPAIARRIQALQRYASSAEYLRLRKRLAGTYP